VAFTHRRQTPVTLYSEIGINGSKNCLHLPTDFDAVGNVLSTTDARGFSSSNVWSATRKLLSTRMPNTPQGVPLVTNIYDTRDWLSRSINPLQQATIYTNDAGQRLIAVTDPLLRTTKFSYDEDGRQIGSTNADQEVTKQKWKARS
jgi:YD repeat-containing protein